MCPSCGMRSDLLQTCMKNIWKNWSKRSDLLHDDLFLALLGSQTRRAKRLRSCGWCRLTTSLIGSNCRSAVRNLAENRTICHHFFLHCLLAPEREVCRWSGRICINLFDRRSRHIVGSPGDLLMEQLRRELSCGPCKPAIATGTISFCIHNVTTLPFLRMLGSKGPEVELVVGLLPNWHNLFRPLGAAGQVGDRLGWAQPCVPCQRRGTCGSFHSLIVLHLCQSFSWHDLWVTNQQLRSSLHVEVALLHAGDEHHHAAHLIFTVGNRRLPPSLMNGGELSELLGLLGTFNSSSILPHRLDGLDQSRSGDVWHGEPCPRDRCSWALQIYPVVGVSETELHAIGVIANCVCCRPWTAPKLKPRSGRVACDHGATGSHRVRATSALKTQNGHPVADEHGDHHREPRLALFHFSDQILVNELLLHCQICVWSEATEDPMEQDLIPVVDLHISVAGRGVPEHRPRERLKSRVWQGWCCLSVPSSARGASLTLERERQDHLDPVQCVVGKKSHWKTWTWRHHLVSLRENIDGTSSVSHDLWNQPGLKRRHHPVIAVVNDHDRGVIRELLAFIDRHEEPRHSDLVGIVGAAVGRSTVASPPLIVLGAPSTVRTASATIARHG